MITNHIANRTIQLVVAACAAVPLTGCAAAPIREAAIVPAAPPATTERVLLAENFHQYNPRWREVRGHWGLLEGKMVQTRDDVRELNTVLFYDPLTISDAEITAETTMLADLPQFQVPDDVGLLTSKRRIAGTGIVFRFQDENNFYLFRTAGEDGVVLGKVMGGTWYELANPRAADFYGARLHTDTPYMLRVRVVGDRIQCWIGNRAVANLEDSSFSTGRVGLTTFQSRASFTGLRVVER